LFVFFNKKEAVPTVNPSLMKSLLQERRKWKVQIKRGNREIGRRHHRVAIVSPVVKPS
jgi:hypothetical protein